MSKINLNIYSLEDYLAAIPKPKSALANALEAIRIWAVCLPLILLACADPWSKAILYNPVGLGDYFIVTLLSLAKALVALWSFGYLLHRYQHIGLFAKTFHLVRKHFVAIHMFHHEDAYPYGKAYTHKNKKYNSEDRLSAAWGVPAILFTCLFFYASGFHYWSILMMVFMLAYATLIIDLYHIYFHHPALWEKKWIRVPKKLFNYLNDCHKWHHYDHETNFGIDFGGLFIDWLCGSYASPKKYQRQLEAMNNDPKINPAVFKNWAYITSVSDNTDDIYYAANAHKRPQRVKNILLGIQKKLFELIQLYPDNESASQYKDRVDALLDKIPEC